MGGMYMFTTSDKDILIDSFKEYCFEDVGNSLVTADAYANVLDKFFTKVVVGKVPRNNYQAIFSEDNLKAIRLEVRNNALRAVLKNFLDFLHKEHFIEDQNTYHITKELIGRIIGETTNKGKKDSVQYLTRKDLRLILSHSSEIHYDGENEYLTPLIVCFSFYCLYQQRHIVKLTLDDVDMENRRIRNMFYKEDLDMAEYIGMNDFFYECMEKYLAYRNKLGVEYTQLLIYKGNPITGKGGINNCLYVYKSARNKHLFSTESMGCDIFISSSMYYQLLNNAEEALTYIFRILDKQNDYYRYAFDDFLAMKRLSAENENVLAKELQELLPISGKKEQWSLKQSLDTLRKETINLPNNMIENEVTTEPLLQYFEPYSYENDIHIKELEDFEMNNKKEVSKIHIQRLVRNSSIADVLKMYYDNQCQLCSTRLLKANGTGYAEAHHIQPYNRVHQGDDTPKNLIVLCPNCHSQFDDLYYAINPHTHEIHCANENDRFHLANMHLIHKLDKKYLEYAWKMFVDQKNLNMNIKQNKKRVTNGDL